MLSPPTPPRPPGPRPPPRPRADAPGAGRHPVVHRRALSDTEQPTRARYGDDAQETGVAGEPDLADLAGPDLADPERATAAQEAAVTEGDGLVRAFGVREGEAGGAVLRDRGGSRDGLPGVDLQDPAQRPDAQDPRRVEHGQVDEHEQGREEDPERPYRCQEHRVQPGHEGHQREHEGTEPERGRTAPGRPGGRVLPGRLRQGNVHCVSLPRSQPKTARTDASTSDAGIWALNSSGSGLSKLTISAMARWTSR